MDDMMPRERQSLADLIGSRLCHDLSNPLGAIGNGVELLDLTGAAQGPELDLVRDAVAWKPRDDMPRRQVKLAYLMMLCAETALPMGGAVTLSMEPGGQWSLSARADRIAVEEALWSVLRFGPGAVGRPLRPSEVQFLALHDAAEAVARTLNYVHDDRNLRLTTA